MHEKRKLFAIHLKLKSPCNTAPTGQKYDVTVFFDLKFLFGTLFESTASPLAYKEEG